MLDDLNQEQLRAVRHAEGPLLVVAGAGTGKTQVITRRIAYLIQTGKAKPEEILALTFTDKAAGEMLDRLDGLIGWLAYRVPVMTFHAFGVQILQRYGHHGGFSTRAELIPKTMKAVLLKQHLSEIKLSYYGVQDDLIDFLEAAVDYIEMLQNADVDLDQYRKYVTGIRAKADLHRLDKAEAEDRLKLYELYERLKKMHGLIDHNDQVTLPLNLLRQKPNVAERLSRQYRYVMVDEYQDTNAAQDALLKAFVPKQGNIFAVGDDDQAIYGFRGAKLSNILEFADYFGVKHPLVLTKNYRSTQPILDTAYRLIRNNDPDRLEARLKLDKRLVGTGEGRKPEFRSYASQIDELEGVAREVATRIKSGEPASGIGILATSHTALQALAKVLRRQQTPFSIASSIKVFEHPELIQMWHLLRWVVLQANDEAVMQLLLGPFVGWSSTQVRRVSEESRSNLVSIEETLERNINRDGDCRELMTRLKAWRDWSKTLPPSEMVYKIIFESDIKERWIKQADLTPRRIQRLFEDLQLWLVQMQQFEALFQPNLASYLEYFPKPPEIETHNQMGEEDGVALLTVHAAKGLEFDSVYIFNNTFEAWSESSIARNQQIPAELNDSNLSLAPEHEKRRLMYVAITRAKRDLVISAATSRADGRAKRLSPFIAEIFGPGDQKQVVTPGSTLEATLIKLQQRSPVLDDNLGYALPFESTDGWLELSVTDLDSYANCPYEFFLENVLKIRSPMGPQVQFGSILHRLFHDYYQSRLDGDPLDIDQLKERLESRWANRGYRTLEEAQVDLDRAAATLEFFYEREEAAKRIVKASELPFSLVIEEAKMRVKGQIDVCFETPDGIEVRDFKTGRQRDQQRLNERAKESLQLRTYALAVAEMEGAPPAKIVLDYVVTGVEGAADLSKIIMRNHRLKLAEIANKIRSKQFLPKKGQFHSCIAARYWGAPDDEGELALVGEDA
jgi:DNA helicase II / ATP-dependent DNA helicase PcrA